MQFQYYSQLDIRDIKTGQQVGTRLRKGKILEFHTRGVSRALALHVFMQSITHGIR